MADKPAAERTEQPSPKRLQKSKDKGQVAQSQEWSATVCIVFLVASLAFSAPSLLQWFVTQAQEGMTGLSGVFADQQTFAAYLKTIITSSLLIMGPLLGALALGSVVSTAVISGVTFAPKALEWKWSAIDPIKGFARLFDVKAAVKLGISIAKLTIVSLVVWHYLQNRIEALTMLRWAWSFQLLTVISQMLLGMLIRVCVVLLAISVIDVVFQIWKHKFDLKMTKQEVKEERKESEGAPEIRARTRRIQIEMARKRMLQEVPKANVVLVNPTHFAVALKYDAKTMDAPVMVAKGADHMADKIREIARAHGIPVLQRPSLARSIYASVEPGDSIPESLYKAVAEVLALIYRLRHRRM